MFFDNDSHEKYGEDYFSKTRMTFGDHIEVLRWHLWRAIVGFVICLVGAFFIGQPAVKFISAPVEKQLIAYQDDRLNEVDEKLKKEEEEDIAAGRDPYTITETEVKSADLIEQLGISDAKPKSEWIKVKSRANAPREVVKFTRIQNHDVKRPGLIALTILEAMMIWFKVCIYIALVLGSPWIFWQLWSFIAAGLYPHEKKLVHVFLPFSILLFLAGVIMCQFIVIPRSISALLWFNQYLGLEPELRLTDWLTFAIMLPLVFGLSFQTPLVMFALERVGIFTVDTYRSKRRMAWFGLAILAAIILPPVDGLTMCLLWVPMVLLYELGIILCKMSPRKPLLDFGESEESEEMVEV